MPLSIWLLKEHFFEHFLEFLPLGIGISSQGAVGLEHVGKLDRGDHCS